MSNPAPLPPGPRARIARGIGEGIAAADAGAPYSAIPYARDVYPLTRAAWSLGYTARQAQLDPANRPSTLSAALDPAEYLERTRDALGEDAFHVAQLSGAALTLEDVAALALTRSSN